MHVTGIVSSASVRPPDVSGGTLLDAAFLVPVCKDAGTAINSLWCPEAGTFWRSTDHRLRVTAAGIIDPEQFFPTVTFRSLDALLQLLVEQPNWAPESLRRILIEQYLPKLLNRGEKSFVSSISSSSGSKLNPFTRSIYVTVLARTCNASILLPDDVVALALSRLSSAAPELLSEGTKLVESKDGSVTESHPFLLYHVLRATHELRPILTTLNPQIEQLTEQITSAARASTERLLARRQIGLLSPSDAVALAFCAAALTFDTKSDTLHYTMPALEAAFTAQDPAGCWPLGRVVLVDKDLEDSRIEMSSYEISWVIAETLLGLARQGNMALGDGPPRIAVDQLVLAGRYAEASIIRLAQVGQEPFRGWCSDHPYGRPMIESWTSATVLQAALSIHGLVEEANRQSVLATFAVTDPREGWPAWLQWDRFRFESEPDSEHPVFAYIHQHIIDRIQADPQGLPRLEQENMSEVLFGPPGTSKTTVVKSMATALGWPVVMLSPGAFIAQGLEYIEAQASSIFARLQQLHHAIVLFDECDELFRERRPNQQNEQMRGITAFVTASMLPKLQDLHDRGRVLFCICTNMIDSLDSAILRPGRIDHILYLGPPDEPARLQWIRSMATNTSLGNKPHLDVALHELAKHSDRFLRKELQRAVRNLGESPPWADPDSAKSAAKRIATEVRQSLTIDEDEYRISKNQRKLYSRPTYTE